MSTFESRLTVRPEQLDLDSPGRRDYFVTLPRDSTWGEHFLPLTVWVGPEAEASKGLVAFGSNHGNEYEGPVALKNLLGEIQLEEVRGRIIIVPVLNPAAFWIGQRESREDDGVNLNRAFVEGAGIHPAMSGITHRIAKFVREYIWPRVHVVLDMHAGGQVARYALCTSFHSLEDARQSRVIEQTAREYGTPFVLVYANATPGLLPTEGENLGKITVGCELGWGDAVNIDGVGHIRQGVLLAARRHGQLRGDARGVHIPEDQKLVSIVNPECSVHSPIHGHYEPLVHLGSYVEKGQLVGQVHDFTRIDDPPLSIRARVDGYLIAHAWKAVVRQGDWVLNVGEEVR